MRATESFGSSAPVGVSSPTFVLNGGKYWFAATGVFNGATITLQKIGPDGVTLVTPATTLALTQAGGITADLPPGAYQMTVSVAVPAVSWEIVRIPGD